MRAYRLVGLALLIFIFSSIVFGQEGKPGYFSLKIQPNLRAGSEGLDRYVGAQTIDTLEFRVYRVNDPKLGVMIPGMGAAATTFVAGVEAVRQGIATPVGSLTQMGTIRLGKRTEGRSPKVKDFVPLACLNDLICPIAEKA